MVERKIETVERYVKIYLRVEPHIQTLRDTNSWELSDFETKTNLKTESQFRLLKAISRNPDLQKDINSYLKSKDIPRNIVRPIPVKQYLEKATREPTEKVDFIRFEKKSEKFTKIKGKNISAESSIKGFKTNAKNLIQKALDIAKRETQDFDGKQLKVNINANIIPNKKLDKDFRETQNRSFQTKVRVKKDSLDYDMFDLDSAVDSFVADYEPSGNITISVSIVNYTI